MMQFRKIVVPVDLTEKNVRAVEVARDLAMQSGGAMHLLHVIEELELPRDEIEGFYEELERHAAEKVEQLARAPRQSGAEVQERIVFGNRAREIVRFAEDEEADLIVLSSHRTNLENPAENWASLSHKVAILAQTPVLLVK